MFFYLIYSFSCVQNVSASHLRTYKLLHFHENVWYKSSDTFSHFSVIFYHSFQSSRTAFVTVAPAHPIHIGLRFSGGLSIFNHVFPFLPRPSLNSYKSLWILLNNVTFLEMPAQYPLIISFHSSNVMRIVRHILNVLFFMTIYFWRTFMYFI